VTGPEHYRAAEALLNPAQRNDGPLVHYVPPTEQQIAMAQVHATLALAAATAYAAEKDWAGDENRSAGEWTRAIS